MRLKHTPRVTDPSGCFSSVGGKRERERERETLKRNGSSMVVTFTASFLSAERFGNGRRMETRMSGNEMCVCVCVGGGGGVMKVKNKTKLIIYV